MTDCQLGLGPPYPLLTNVEPADRCASTNDKTDAGSLGTNQVLYATALANAEVNSGAREPLPVPLDRRTAPAGGTTPANSARASSTAARRFEAVVGTVR